MYLRARSELVALWDAAPDKSLKSVAKVLFPEQGALESEHSSFPATRRHERRPGGSSD